MSTREERNLIRQVKCLRDREGNFTAKHLKVETNVTHVSDRTVRRTLNKNGCRYLKSRKKGLMSQADRLGRVAFARKMLKEYSDDFWKHGLAFYLDGTAFAYKRNPCDQAKAPRGMVWRKRSEGLN